MKIMRSYYCVAVASTVLLPSAYSLDLSDFQTCISNSGTGPVCQLDSGVWDVDSTLVVGRSSITVQGTPGDASDVVLRRSTVLGLSGPIIQSASGATFTFQWFTVDGNRQNTGLCTTSSTALADVDFGLAGVATVQDINFISAPVRGLGLGTAAGVSGASTVAYSNFGQGFSAYGYSLSAPETATRWQGIITSGEYTGVWYNNIAFDGLAAIQVYDGQFGYIIGNVLQENRYEQPDGISGGQILIEEQPSYVSLADNYINGNYWTTTGHNTSNTDMLCNPGASGLYPFGIEGSGTGHRYYNNEIIQNLAYGVLLRPWSSTEPLDSNLVSGYDPFCTGTCTYVPHYIDSNAGCYLYAGCYSGGGWPASMAVAGLNVNSTTAGPSGTGSVTNLTLDHVRVTNNGWNGVSLYNVSSGPGFIDSVNGSNYACIQGNYNYNLITAGSASGFTSYTNLCP